MKNLIAVFAAVLFSLSVVPVPTAYGQATTSTTTTSVAVALGDSVVQVASATGITAPSNGAAANATTIFLIDKEEMRVTAVNGKVITVQRGSDGSPRTSHANGATVYLGPPNYFSNYDPSGSCTSSLQVNLPLPSSSSGRIWHCVNSVWTEYALNRDLVATGSVLDAALATGVVIVPATPGVTYTVLSGTLMPVGGTAATCTAVNITDSDLGSTDVESFLISGTLAANVPHDESSGASIVTVGGHVAFGTGFTAGKGIGIISTGSTCATATSFVYRVLYKAAF